MTSKEAVDRLAADPARTGILLDFDGSLAPIVCDPATSALPAGLDETLALLGAHHAVVAVISGRPVDFLADRIRARGVLLYGLYGLQTHRDGVTHLHPDVEAWLPQVAAARTALDAAGTRRHGLTVEDKGISLALHWRNADDRTAAEGAAGAIADEVAAATGLRVEPGKFVLELRPPIAHDKGDAVRDVLDGHHPALALYIGDDLGDLPAFAAVKAHGGVTALVDHGAETPDRLRTAADVLLPDVEAAATFLQALARRAG